MFDAAGNFMRAWGGAGSGYDWPEREHGIHIDHIDHKGFVPRSDCRRCRETDCMAGVGGLEVRRETGKE